MSHDVRQVADAVLYEGYVLYPYRASAQKNRSRWQFGVLMPPAYAAAEPSERSVTRAECVFEHAGQPGVKVIARFLQVQRRHTPAGPAGPSATSAPWSPSVWDEAVPREIAVAVGSPRLLGEESVSQFVIPGGQEQETGAAAPVTRRRERLLGSVRVHATPLPGPWRAARLTAAVANESGMLPGPVAREQALPSALVAVHMIITISGGAFVSMTDPPEWAEAEVRSCDNIGCWPVLAGPPSPRMTPLTRASPGGIRSGTHRSRPAPIRSSWQVTASPRAAG